VTERYRVWTMVSEKPFVEDSVVSNRDDGYDWIPDGMVYGMTSKCAWATNTVLMLEPFDEPLDVSPANSGNADGTVMGQHKSKGPFANQSQIGLPKTLVSERKAPYN
jgi:hypothetical protein